MAARTRTTWLVATGAGILLWLILSQNLAARWADPGRTPGVTAKPTWSQHRNARWGFTVRMPASWRVAKRPVTSLTDPREILSVGTFALRHHPSRCAAFAGGVRERMGPRDAFLTLMERGYDRVSRWSDFPPRPLRFRPTRENTRAAEPVCGDRPSSQVHWLNFADAGRHLHVLMVIGPKAPGAARRQAWRILNSLELDPNVTPHWRSSG